jgi:O-antigen ligase
MRLFVAHPFLGVGPDNFRHLYGAELGLEAWDERVQANNVYLEVLADLGIIGVAVFAWIVAGPIRSTVKSLASITYVGVVLALVAFLVHGLLDSFLAFTPTAFLFWMLLGVAQSQNPQVSGR